MSKLTSLQAAQFQILLNFASFAQDSPPTQPQQDHTHQNIALCCCLRTHLLQHTVKEKDIWAMNFLILPQIQILRGKKIYRAESDSMRHNRNDHSGQCLLVPNVCFLFTTALRYHLHHPVPAKVHPWPRRCPHQKVLHSKHSHGKKWKKLHYTLESALAEQPLYIRIMEGVSSTYQPQDSLGLAAFLGSLLPWYAGYRGTEDTC